MVNKFTEVEKLCYAEATFFEIPRIKKNMLFITLRLKVITFHIIDWNGYIRYY